MEWLKRRENSRPGRSTASKFASSLGTTWLAACFPLAIPGSEKNTDWRKCNN